MNDDLGRLLIVEDDEDLRELLVEELKELELPIAVAMNGRDAFEIVMDGIQKKNPILAILSDIAMPDMNGIEFLTELRWHDVYTPLVFLTAYGDKEKITQALKLGAYDYIEKPSTAKHIRHVMREASQYGYYLREIEKEIEDLKKNKTMSLGQEKVILAAKRALLMMRLQSAISKKDE